MNTEAQMNQMLRNVLKYTKSSYDFFTQVFSSEKKCDLYGLHSDARGSYCRDFCAHWLNASMQRC